MALLPTCTRRLEWDAAHRVLRHESKCGTLHGHRYVAEIECQAEQLDDVGRVVDFGVVKQIVGQWIDDHWDHTTMVNTADSALLDFVTDEHKLLGKRAPYVMPCEPTAENIALDLQGIASELLSGTGVRVVRVRVWETPNCSAEVDAR